MNKKLLFSLTIFTFAFAVVFGFGTLNNAAAVASGEHNYEYPGQVNLIGIDEAFTSVGPGRDFDKSLDFSFETRGLDGSFSPER